MSADLTRALSSVLIDLEPGDGWRAIQTYIQGPGRVVVILARLGEGPTECLCGMDDDEDDCCEYCDFGPPESDYRDVLVIISDLAP